MNCPKCGQPVDAGASYCGNCGQAIATVPAPAAVQPAPASQPAESVAPSAPSGVTSMPVYGGFWLRFVAAFIDGIILRIAETPINLVFPAHTTNVGLRSYTMASPTASLLSFAIFLLYYALMESSSMQATLGKKALGLKVTDLSGDRIQFSKALVREVSKLLSAIIFLIGFIMAAFTEKKQALHDKIAGTLVVKA